MRPHLSDEEKLARKRAYDKAYRETHREKLAAQNKVYKKVWREANKEKIRDYDRVYYQANKERIQAAAREVYAPAWRERNREKLRAAARARHHKIKVEDREHYLQDRREREARRRARLRGNGGQILKRDLERLVNRHGGLCAYCHGKPATDLDHIVPLARGGRHTIGNVLPACHSCNSSKWSLLLAEWRYSSLTQIHPVRCPPGWFQTTSVQVEPAGHDWLPGSPGGPGGPGSPGGPGD